MQQLIVAAAIRHGIDPNWLLRVANCESGDRAYAQNPSGPYDGVFQFWPPTFRAHGGVHIWDAAEQADIAATMFAAGESSAWGCR